MALPRIRMTIAEIMICVVVCGIFFGWPELLIPAVVLGLVGVAKSTGLSLLEFLILVVTPPLCLGLILYILFWIYHVVHRDSGVSEIGPFDWPFVLSVSTVITIGGVWFRGLRGWRLRKRSAESTNPGSTIKPIERPESL